MITLSRPRVFRLMAPICGLLLLTFFVFIYIEDPKLYASLMRAMIKIPAAHAFIDWEYVVSAIRCWSEGVDVYAHNTCFEVWPDEPFAYSPLLLRATLLRNVENWINPTMLLVGVLFFLSLATLPPPSCWRDVFITLLATLSCATFLAMERGNIDLILFLMIVAGIHLRRLPLVFRLGGYGLIVLAGLVKFYPFITLIVVLRERLVVLALVSVVSIGALTALLFYDSELALMSANLPSPSYFMLQFSSANLPVGIGMSIGKILEKWVHLDAGTARAISASVGHILLPILTVSAITTAFVIGFRCRLPTKQTNLSTSQTDFLVAGAALICGCFFASQSVFYRGIYLLLALPGLAELSRQTLMPVGRRLFESAGAAIVFVLWTPFLDQCLIFGGLTGRLEYTGWPQSRGAFFADIYYKFPDPLGYLLWLASELTWWWIITLFFAVLGAFVASTELWAFVWRLLQLERFSQIKY